MKPTLRKFRNLAVALVTLLTASLNAMAQCPEPEDAKVYDITGTTVKANWSPVPDAMGYEYAIKTDSLPPQAGTFTTNTTILIQGLASDRKYCLHLRARCSNGTSGWVIRCFTTTCEGVQVQNLVVDNVIGSSARAAWEPFQIGNGYEYAITETPAPPASGQPTASASVVFQGLEPGRTYCVHVKSLCPVSGTYTDWQTTCFNTPLAVAGIAANKGISIYPNPAKTRLNIDIQNIANTHTVILRDVVGRVVHKAALQEDRTSINISAVTPGIYYISISGADVNMVQRIVKE